MIDIQQSDSVIHIHMYISVLFFIVFIIVYYEILIIVLGAV